MQADSGVFSGAFADSGLKHPSVIESQITPRLIEPSTDIVGIMAPLVHAAILHLNSYDQKLGSCNPQRLASLTQTIPFENTTSILLEQSNMQNDFSHLEPDKVAGLFDHSILTGLLCEITSRTLNTPRQEQFTDANGGLLHDIGKIVNPENWAITGKLNEQQLAGMQLHPIYGKDLFHRLMQTHRIETPYQIQKEISLNILLHHASNFHLGSRGPKAYPIINDKELLSKSMNYNRFKIGFCDRILSALATKLAHETNSFDGRRGEAKLFAYHSVLEGMRQTVQELNVDAKNCPQIPICQIDESIPAKYLDTLALFSNGLQITGNELNTYRDQGIKGILNNTVMRFIEEHLDLPGQPLPIVAGGLVHNLLIKDTESLFK